MKRRLLAIVFALLMLCQMLSFSILATDIIPGENETEDFPWGDAEPEVPGPTHTPGDVNGDDAVDTMDATTLMQYLAQYDVTVVEDALDINGDGSVDTMDATTLMQYLAQYDVEIH